MSIKKQDRVKMHTCGEAKFPKNLDQTFIVSSEPRMLCGTEVVAIDLECTGERAYTAFATEFLEVCS